jgi:hypothetical protein
MPDIYVLCSEEDAQLLKPHLGMVGKSWRKTFVTLLNLDPSLEEGSTTVIPFAASDSAARLQVLCSARSVGLSDTREQHWSGSIALVLGYEHPPDDGGEVLRATVEFKII